MSATAPQHVSPMDLPLPREAPPSSRRNKSIAAGLRRSLSGSITIPDSVSESALKHRDGLRRLTKRLREVDPSLPARATSIVGMGGMIIREIRGGSRHEEVTTATAMSETTMGPNGVESVIPITTPRTEEERLRQWRDSGDVTPPMSAEDLAGDALVHLTQRLASVVPMKGLNKPVGSVLVNNHRQITNRWLELSRIAADVKKHNAHLDALRARSRDYAAILQSSSQTAVTLRERVRSVLVAIQGIESAAATHDAQRMNAYLQLLNEVATGAALEAGEIAKRQEQLMAGLMSDAEVIAKSARRAHSRSSLFAVSALGALAAGVVLTGGAGLLVSGTLATLTAIAGGGMLTGLTCGALLDASDAHEKIERGMQEMQTVSERAGSLVEGDARVWRSISVASRMAEGRARNVPSVFQSSQWALIGPQVMQSLHEAHMGFVQLLRTLDMYVVYLFSSGFSIPGIDLATIMDGATIDAARQELARMDASQLPTSTAAPM